MVYSQVQAIYRNGMLTVLEPLDLPEGVWVSLQINFVPSDSVKQAPVPQFIHPAKFVKAEKLDNLIGLIAIGGDALADSEAIYDSGE